MQDDAKRDLSKVRLDLAKERIGFAKEIWKLGDYKTVANRSYYAVFSAMRAVLALDGFDSRKHSGIVAEFRRRYLKTDLLPTELSFTIDSLIEIRQGSDYDDFYLISKEEVATQLARAEEFVNAVEEFLIAQYARNGTSEKESSQQKGIL